jgi:4-carboxymuconolactone decarboxylase
MKRIQSENFEYLRKQHTKVFTAYQEFGRSIHEEGGPLDERVRSLIKVAISATGRHELALRTHIGKARAAGCSRDEIEHAVLLTAPTAGFPTMMSGLLVLREELTEE